MPLYFKKLAMLLRAHIDKASWQLLMAVTVLHIAATWLLLLAANETELLGLNTYFYYYVVTTSTVGYGDMSAVTPMGRWVVALFQIPFGLALFGVLLGKVGQLVTFWVKRAMTGNKNLAHLTDHIVIFGWHEQRTKKIVDYILADNKRKDRQIILAVNDLEEHPLANYSEVEFAHLTSFTDEKELDRIAISQADKIIIDGKDDDQTFTTALMISPLIKEVAHISAHFIDESKVSLLRTHCKNVECSSTKSAEILVRAMQDPGSSRVQEELLSTLHGDTQFSVQLPENIAALPFSAFFHYFKEKHDAIILGVAHDLNAFNMDLNPPLHYQIKGGDILHYISPERILPSEVKWSEIK